MKMDDWSRMARDIGEVYSHYEGFVVLHGTDTLAYTASALSFMLQNLGRTPAVYIIPSLTCCCCRQDSRGHRIPDSLLRDPQRRPGQHHQRPHLRCQLHHS